VVLSEGLIVRHSTFGPGRVVHANATHVWVYFPELPGPAEVVVKKLSVALSHLTEAPNIKDPRLAHVPVNSPIA